MLSTRMSCRHLGNVWAHLGNMRAVAAKPFFMSMTMAVSAGALLSSEVGSGDEGCVLAQDPSWTVRQGPVRRDTW
jgi:hypothetical protein